MSDGTVWCWGNNVLGQCGADPSAPDAGPLGPVKVDISGVLDLTVAAAVSCAVVQGGTVMCWGANGYGQLGLGTTDSLPHATPAAVVF
jgi:alpha-tubulin suppressor-like RCC1 family protein